jgi:peptide/nickel transport system substrate-binding protein
MGKCARLFALLATLLVVGCSPLAAGPELPRPALPAPTIFTSTTAPSELATTTTLDEATLLATRCPVVFCLVYHLNEEAVWSDGAPVVAADFARTVEVLADPPAGEALPGYGLVSEVEIIDDKTVRLLFSEPYGPWEGLFARVIPAHSDSLQLPDVPTNGPYRFAEWIPGDRIVLDRDPGWWSDTDRISGEPLGTVAQVTFVFIADTDEMLERLESGDVDVISARADVGLVESLGAIEGVDYRLAAGPFWEHIDFHHDDEMFSQAWVRRAVDLAIDRQKILDRTIRLLDPSAAGLDNTVWMSGTEHYETHYTDRYDPAAAEALLVDNGCVRNGSTYVCGEREMSFVWASTNDDPLRREILQSVREDLAVVGIGVEADLRSPSDFVTRDFLFGGSDVWQLINFSWRSLPEPVAANPTYFCDDSDLNVNRYCSPEVEELVRSTETVVDPARRAATYNEADRLYLEDLAVIPLYQKPELMAWSGELSGLMPNYTTSTDLWNLATWTGKREIVIALPSEPGSLGALPTGDEAANTVMSVLMYGALGMSPSQEHKPLLIDSVDFVEG